MATRTPREWRLVRMDEVRSTSSMARLSVISRHSCDGSMAVARNTRSTSSTRAACCDWRCADPIGVGHGELATAAPLLDPVHGHVGVAQQIVAGLAVLAQRNADAHGGDHLVRAAEGDRVAEGIEDGVRHLAGVIGGRDPL